MVVIGEEGVAGFTFIVAMTSKSEQEKDPKYSGGFDNTKGDDNDY